MGKGEIERTENKIGKSVDNVGLVCSLLISNIHSLFLANYLQFLRQKSVVTKFFSHLYNAMFFNFLFFIVLKILVLKFRIFKMF